MMRYLSVHDMVWLNTTLVGQPSAFDYALLEAAVAAQYGYGDSTDVMGQAAAFMATLVGRPPFAAGALPTAFVGSAAFLSLNGVQIMTSPDIAAAMRDLARGADRADEIIASMAGVRTADQSLSVREAIVAVISHNSAVLVALS